MGFSESGRVARKTASTIEHALVGNLCVRVVASAAPEFARAGLCTAAESQLLCMADHFEWTASSASGENVSRENILHFLPGLENAYFTAGVGDSRLTR